MRPDLDYLVFYVTFNSLGDIATGSLQVEETGAYCTVNHRAPAGQHDLIMKKNLLVEFYLDF